MLVSVNAANTGLSPLARGTQVDASGDPRHGRFIPAGAGNTLIKCSPWRHSTVYPRWRGEHLAHYNGGASLNGLSPLARGTLYCELYDVEYLRFIPAGAGNTLNITYY